MIDLKTDIHAILSDAERVKIFNWCKQNLQFVFDDGGNWCIFSDAVGLCYSIAKPESGAGNSVFGRLEYAKKIFNL